MLWSMVAAGGFVDDVNLEMAELVLVASGAVYDVDLDSGSWRC